MRGYREEGEDLKEAQVEDGVHRVDVRPEDHVDYDELGVEDQPPREEGAHHAATVLLEVKQNNNLNWTVSRDFSFRVLLAFMHQNLLSQHRLCLSTTPLTLDEASGGGVRKAGLPWEVGSRRGRVSSDPPSSGSAAGRWSWSMSMVKPPEWPPPPTPPLREAIPSTSYTRRAET